MAGSGFVWGGLLQGIGQGMAAKGQSDLEERRKVALESLRHSNAMSEAATEHGYKLDQQANQADLNDRNNARQAERDTNKSVIIEGVKTQGRLTVEQAQAANAQALAKLQSGLTLSRELTLQAQKLSDDLSKLGQEVGDYRVAGDGSIWAYSKTGKVLGHSKPGKFVPPTAGGAGGAGSVLGGLGLGTPGASPAPGTTEPAEPAPAKPAPPAPRAPSTGRGIQAPRAGNRGAPAAGQKTYTTADAQATAVKNNVPIEEVHRRMRDAGYKLVGA